MEKNFEYNTNIKERTRQNYIWIKKCNTLDEKLKEIFDFKVPDYVVDDIMEQNTIENIISLTLLAKFNNRISEEDTNTFIEELKKSNKFKKICENINNTIK